MYLVDTNIVSEARRGSQEAVRWLRSIDPEAVHLSVITIGEIVRGIAMKRRRDPDMATRLEAWLSDLRSAHAARILSVTDAVAVTWGRLSALRTRGDADGLIAATAITHDLTLVTRNTADFADLPIKMIDPWS
jgi:toxin FitB